MDSSGQAKCLLFDSNVIFVVNCTADSLLEGVYNELPPMLTFSQKQSEDLSTNLGIPFSKCDQILLVESGAESSSTKKHCTRIDNIDSCNDISKVVMVASNGGSPNKNDSSVDLSKRIDGADDGVQDFDCVITGGKFPSNDAIGEKELKLAGGLVEMKIEKP
ncbi:unnamed protein product [Arabis nemorensis]|uniref:Uncharacterized protein n=1 Tax=Arabis nemorensis TaxID=586526 RepID=A0A565BA99_9BRAS|nr:unnamed protein product [Arabis nemorensis]